jgi:hypothetical protein
LCEGAQILARVGPKVVLASEVMAATTEILIQYKDKIPKEQMEQQRKVLIKKMLDQRVDIKLIYYDAERKIPKENMEKIKDRLTEQFEMMEIPRRMKAADCGSRRELEERLTALGTSLEREKKLFCERVIAQQWLQQQVHINEDVGHEEMLNYYQDHAADFEHPARARWEQLMVRKSSFRTEAEARAVLAQMGNQVLDGALLSDVAKARSQGPSAKQGGQRDWTTRGSLVSEALDQAIFGLPVGQLSQILEDKQGFHILRVIERQEATRTPFLEAQVDIRKKITEQREKEARENYLTQLKLDVPISTVFDRETARKEETSTFSRYLDR